MPSTFISSLEVGSVILFGQLAGRKQGQLFSLV